MTGPLAGVRCIGLEGADILATTLASCGTSYARRFAGT